ncbi:SRPBCC domain-containing protein [Aeoliella mucimassa]|uniref:Activator of Hsp90 ATPase homologue 1/2-like C-terminal domain-containing protein n=1 Tax=Aeoliella mucimassa TaxID=2527972 RepID=A0A518AGI0_9BACT|nr:SRPBCC domain-containing protein [Aeoliella mucimassa]QDU53833.1 hypothetical protein Pan181_00110 [Aeoliella mucimassa]
MAADTQSDAQVSGCEMIITRTFDAPRELVWSVLTDPKHIGEWWGPEGFTTTTERYELRVGGTWKHMMHGPDGTDYPNKSVFTEVVAPERLAYKHAGGDEESGGVSFTSQITLEKLSESQTKVTLRNTFPSPEEVQRVIEQYGALEGGQQSLARWAAFTEPRATRTIVITRVFDALRPLVWSAFTRPEHITQWWGPRGFDTTVTEYDFRVGGTCKYVMTGPDGAQYPVKGQVLELERGEKLVMTDEFDEGFDAGGADLPTGIITSFLFDDLGEQTRLTMLIEHDSVESREQHAKMGVTEGWGSSFDCMDDHLQLLTGTDPYALSLKVLSDTEVELTRRFDAPRELVFQALTSAEHLQRWWGCREFECTTCEVDFRVGGQWRIVQRAPDGTEHPFCGEYLEIDSPNRYANTFIYDVDFIRDHPSIETITLTETDGQTLLVNHIKYDSVESRDGHMGSGMESGATESMDRLGELLLVMDK